MKTILVINASARKHQSYSRKLTQIFLDCRRVLQAGDKIVYRDLANAPIPHVNEAWINAATKAAACRSADESEVLRISDTYIAELREADIIVLGTPMYNWSIPSVLKAYIDQVMRLNETFRINPGNPAQPYMGLLPGKRLVLLPARGGDGYENGGRNAHLDFQTTYLRTVFQMMGIEAIHVVAVNGTSHEASPSVEQAHAEIRALIDGGELS